MTFEELGLNERLLEALSYMGFVNATPIQEQALPHVLAGEDLIACAQTGTGKTGAFLLPILHRLCEKPSDKTTTLILVPTRELAIQIDDQLQGLTYTLDIESKAIFGGGSGSDWESEKKALMTGANIIISTPGKMLSHLNLKYFTLENVEHLILDEADRMLDIGFYDDIMKIMSFVPDNSQKLLFSATMPPKIRDFSKKILKNPFEISLSISKPAEGILQASYLVYDQQKIELLKLLINDKPNYKSIIIFSSTKKKVSEIVRALKGNGYTVEGISSDLDQPTRTRVITEFTAKQIRVLVGSDVISRGIDIKDINLVINYDVPNDAEDYVHRIGRTARADTTGVAITLINPSDMEKFDRIEKLIEKEVIKLPVFPELGTSPEWKVVKERKKFFKKKK